MNWKWSNFSPADQERIILGLIPLLSHASVPHITSMLRVLKEIGYKLDFKSLQMKEAILFGITSRFGTFSIPLYNEEGAELASILFFLGCIGLKWEEIPYETKKDHIYPGIVKYLPFYNQRQVSNLIFG
jgi:hypothetical protein